jgi:hypothetical protein
MAAELEKIGEHIGDMINKAVKEELDKVPKG